MAGKNENEMKRFNIRMPQEMYDRIELAAHKRGVAVSAFINMKLDEILKQDETSNAMRIMTDPVAMQAMMAQMNLGSEESSEEIEDKKE